MACGSRLVLEPQRDALPIQALQGGVDHVANLEHGGHIAVQAPPALLHRRPWEPLAVNRQEDQETQLAAGLLYQREPSGGTWLPCIAGSLQGFAAVLVRRYIKPHGPLVARVWLDIGDHHVLRALRRPHQLSIGGLLHDLEVRIPLLPEGLFVCLPKGIRHAAVP